MIHINPDPVGVVAQYPGQTPATRYVRGWSEQLPLVLDDQGKLVHATHLAGFAGVTEAEATYSPRFIAGTTTLAEAGNLVAQA